jgi:TolB-like protein/DNA-binding winged helix-turn-helix (wHTH) protein/cytochrome c-type biogenesis protein CcmH/NrfG
MLPSRSPSTRVRFGPFEVDSRTGELFKNGRKLRLQEQPFRVLQMLVERPGELITRDELRDRLWPKDTFVDFDHGLNAAVNRLRERLGDVSDRPQYIETLPRRGYRFVAPVEPAADARTIPEQAPETSGQPEPVSLKPRRRIFAIAAGLVSLILAAFLLAFFAAPLRDRLLPPRPTAIHSLAVLPLENLSGDPSQEYFADGMTDELITDLAKIQSLRVISRTSVMLYKGVRKTAPEIGRELDVDALIEGSVVRSGGVVRITAQLIRVRDDRHLWAESYERNVRDVVALQNEIAGAIARQVRAQLTPSERQGLAGARQVNPDAYQAYLKARYFFSQRRGQAGGSKGVEYAQKAVELDPGYAAGYAALAEAYVNASYLGDAPPAEYMPLAEQAARKALELDPSLGSAHVALGMIALTYRWDWNGAERELKEAIRLDPNNADAHLVYANHLAAVGRLDEAIREIRRAQRLDPLSLWVNRDVGRMLFFARRYDEAIQQLNKTAEMHPDSPAIYIWTSAVYHKKGASDRAVAMELKHLRNIGVSTASLAILKRAYTSSGEREFWRQVVGQQGNSGKNAIGSYPMAVACSLAGENNHAFDWLEKAFAERSVWLTWIRVDPEMDDLRADPRFANIVRRMNLH